MDTIRVMIADDHAILRAGLRSLLALQEDMELIAEAIDGQDAVNKAEQNKPDVLLMDITMPGMNGIEALKHVRKVSPGSRVLILTMHDDHAYLRSVLAAGGSGYLVKRAADTELLAAIRTVHQGRSYIDVGLENNQLQAVLDNDEQEALDAGGRSLDTLSERERQVLELVALGYTQRSWRRTVSECEDRRDLPFAAFRKVGTTLAGRAGKICVRPRPTRYQSGNLVGSLCTFSKVRATIFLTHLQ